MRNLQVSQIFNDIADMLEIKGENPFRVRAYRRAAQNIEALADDVTTLLERGTLEEIPGIGRELAAKIREIITTGTFREYEHLKREIPAGVVQLLQIPGVGPKTAKLLYEEKGIESVERLEVAAKAGELQGLPGIKAKTEEKILRGIELLKRSAGRMPLARALSIAQEIMATLQKVEGVKRMSPAGSLRRMKETVGDIDLLVISTDPGKVMEALIGLPIAQEILARGETKSSIMTPQGIQVDVRVVEPEAFGAALAYFTGSKTHNVRLRDMAKRKGLKISEYGVYEEQTGKRIAGREEAELYAILGLPFIPPELREDAGEIEAALKGELPDLVTVEDIQGDLHIHSRWSDGAHAIAEVAEAARKRGYHYIAITDHSKALGIARGLSAEDLEKQLEEIRRLNRQLKGFRILTGIEVDILPDGNLDLPDHVLAKLDVVVASIHSAFRQDRETMTKRIVRALSNRYVRVLGHPTGRLLGEREPFEFDFDQVLYAARQNGAALEVNATPSRLDLNDAHARRAKEAGVPLVINTDTHTIANFDHITLGVATARRGWIEKTDVLNTLPLAALLQRLAR